MRFGVLMLPIDPWPAVVSRAREVEALGYDHLWTYDHLTWRRYREHTWYSAIPWLTGVAAVTKRIRLGTMVAAPNARHPLTLAKEAVTLADISGGRLTLGLGAGGLSYDATVFGADLLGPRALLDRLGEFVELFDALMHQPAVTYNGRYYTTNEALVLPQPRIPLAIAAGGARALALVARFGDAWITYGDTSAGDRDLTPDGTEVIVRAQTERLAAACDAIGRDPATIDRIYLVGNTEARPLATTAAFDDFVGRYDALGFTDIVFHHPIPGDPVWNEPVTIVDDIARDVLPHWQAGR